MSWEQLVELIRNILFTQTGIPNLSGGNVLMICVGLALSLPCHCKGL